MQRFIGAQVDQLKKLGIRVINETPQIIKFRPDPYNVKNNMTELGKAAFLEAKSFTKAPPAPQLFMVMLEQQDQGFYNSLKRAARTRSLHSRRHAVH